MFKHRHNIDMRKKLNFFQIFCLFMCCLVTVVEICTTHPLPILYVCCPVFGFFNLLATLATYNTAPLNSNRKAIKFNMMTAAAKATQSLLRHVALRTHAQFITAASLSSLSSLVPEAPQSAMDGSDKSLNRITRTESIVSHL